MYELALFAGAGGGILGSHLAGWRTVAAVEIDPYCRSILLKRQDEGHIPAFPIWDDVRTFDGRPFRGVVDLVSAGFPCQPFSVAGKQAAADDERNMWPDTVRVLREVRPRWALLENVPGLLSGSHGYFGQILGDLAESGFDAVWHCVSAADVGAPHLRKRVWTVAHANEHEHEGGAPAVGWTGAEDVSADADRRRTHTEQVGESGRCGASDACRNGSQRPVADADEWRREGERVGGVLDLERPALGNDVDGRGSPSSSHSSSVGRDQGRASDAAQGQAGRDADRGGICGDVRNPGCTRLEGDWASESQPAAAGWWATEPRLGRVAHGVAHRVDRLRAIGNGQVPGVVLRVLEEAGLARMEDSE